MKKNIITIFLATFSMMATAQKLELAEFSKIDINGPYEVKISKSNTYGVWLEATTDMKQHAHINVVENELKLSFEQKTYEKKKGSYLRVWIDLPNLEKIKAAGMSSIEMQGRFKVQGKAFEVDLDDVASVKGLEMDAEKCSIDLSGIANINILGIFSELELKLGGNSNADLDISTKTFKCKAGGNASFEGVKASVADIDMGGNSKGRLNVTESIYVKLDGNSKLTYSGPNTLRIETDIKGLGKLEKKLDYR